ncbi:Ras GTPase activating protein ira2, partial [Coemansia sp. RSA 2703]
MGGRPSTDYVASEPDIEANNADLAGVTPKDFTAVQRFIFDHLDRLESYLARESMVRMNVNSKANDKRKSTLSRSANLATAAITASANGQGATSPSAERAPGSSGHGKTPNGGDNGGQSGEVTATENLFTQVSYVMRQLGPLAAPVEVTMSKMAAAVEAGSNNNIGSEEMFNDILRRDVGRNTDSIAKKAIVYIGGVSREKRPVVYVIARRMQMQYLDMDLVMLHILRLIEPFSTKGFEVFFDLTQFGPANEVSAQWLGQLKRIVPESIINNVQSIYWYNVNSHFRKYAKNVNLSLPQRLARRSVFPHTLSDLSEFLASPQADLPPGTVSLDSDNGINISPVTRVSRSQPALPCMVKVTPEAMQITALRRQEVFGLSTYFNDVFHITEISDVQMMPNTDFPVSADGSEASSSHKIRGGLQRTASRNSESENGPNGRGKSEDQLVSIRFEGGSIPLIFSSPKAELLFKALRSARARFTTHTNVQTVQERAIRPADVPGTLLNVALLNCGSENSALRISAYRMLISVVATFNMDVGHELAFASDLCLPPNPLQFIFRICTRLSISAPDMTLELLSEALLAFTKCAQNLKPWILHYIQPWLLCLGQFTHDTTTHPDANERTLDIIRSLVRLHLKEPT